MPNDPLLVDGDGDGFAEEGGGTFPGGDCDDTNPEINPSETERCDEKDNDCDGEVDEGFDSDEDGFLDADACSALPNGTDCDDGDFQINPGMTERCDEKDNDCDGEVDEGFDNDGDGFSSCAEDDAGCDDLDPAVYPGAKELCDGIDNNCNGRLDEGFLADNGTSECVDDDLDGYTEQDGDCDDTDADRSPGVTEVCDNLDNNCDGTVDEGFDLDGDGYATCNGDCDDTDPDINPGAPEVCDGIDNNCWGGADEIFQTDTDLDGVIDCMDCAPEDGSVYPGAQETCDGMDNDCDGTADEGFDSDGDGYGGCEGQDCDDTRADVYPGAEELCDAADNDCDGEVDEGFDDDGDGFSACGSPADCDDTRPGVYPGAPENCFDGIDNDCDGDTDESEDADGDGQTNCEGDCDDSDPEVNAGAEEVCDGVDNDCDDIVDEGFDTDGDTYTVCDARGADCDDTDPTVHPGAIEDCTDGIDNNCDGNADEDTDADQDGVSSCSGDCDDSDPSVYPGAAEICDDRDNDCSGGDGDFYVSQRVDGQTPRDFSSIQAAIDAAQVIDGCSVVVGPGTYTELVDFKGKLIHLRSELGPDDTIIDGAAQGTVVTFQNAEGAAAMLDGFTITGGAGAVALVNCVPPPCDSLYFGAGVDVRDGASPTVRNNVFYANLTFYGGGLYSYESSPVVENNLFLENEGDGGAALGAYGGAPVVRNNEFDSNIGNYMGSTVYFDSVDGGVIEENSFHDNTMSDLLSTGEGQGTIQLQDCNGVSVSGNVVSNNQATVAAGIALGNNVDTVVEGNTFDDNVSTYLGGAIVTYRGDTTAIRDNVFSGNVAPYGGGAVYCDGESGGAVDIEVSGNTFEQNDGGLFAGAVAAVTDCTADLFHNVFVRNQALDGAGGALYIENGNLTASNNIFWGNKSIDGGGASVSGTGESTFQHNTFYGNSASASGGGVYFVDISPVFQNNLVTFGLSGAGLYYEENTVAPVTQNFLYNDFYGNPGTETNLQGLVAINGNISVDPVYVDPYTGDFHLQSGSPAADAGDPASGTDPDGSPPDMGAYGGPLGTW